MKRPRSDYVIQTVRNAFRLLEAFQEAEQLGVTELSRKLGLHKNNVFRLLATLEEAGYVEQCCDSDRYRLDVRCLELGQAYARTRGLIQLSRPVLEELARDSGESAHLGAIRNFEVVHLDGAQAGHLIQTGLRVGRSLPVHCTALGKVLVACGAPDFLDRFEQERLQGGPLPASTPQTIVDPDKLREHLHAVASQGFALDIEECERGLCCAATPVYEASGRLVGALSVSAPAFRLADGILEGATVPALVRAADQLSRRLGFVPR
jgi:DNA-binding IclR family transcriptional regulator